ncbi:MAG: hypothetical protein A2566_02160 [Candidatus Zambryskibacteria bacterium RIFOXYD1_FULL_40_13]|nr:MAG: Glycosyl transferase group 1 [Parcubacteria group bacterium GW2011_GWC1_39_12]KKR18940.1 MAG: Glycosyl transferase group 1 [Parcubacteria group bacterium GW2011_GWF1_39_37]KKR35583.1 MAG: Glycosyl transferase group 1 [Parcubacteria group bacterium GW2011_GWC2_40_10]KKR51994.1 MAG: Glycosyl transferase group 1 [Parcubacteria group bacterium GW2011_GWE1_40_20]KKR68495.1 MAG: Glycosyl transferase group 1 [Parcubacteria group bacterium GW2011_GWF2_40_69]KKR80381.1 MAG: Glycosyl transferase
MRLLIFTQKVDSSDSVLGFFHSWLLEFAKKVDHVAVICLYKGEVSLPDNVNVYSLGKESGVSKLSYLINLFRHVHKLSGSYDRVFIHMNPIYLVLCGLYFKAKGIKTYLWYVHRSVDFKLRIATMFADKVFSSTKESFKINTNKVVCLGHGVDTNILSYTSHLYTGKTLRIAHIGRITKIKNIETLIDAGYQLKQKGLDVEIVLFGECATEVDKNYKDSLQKMIEEKSMKNNVQFAGSVLYRDLPARLFNCHITVNLAPRGGMDKAVLESILLGMPAFVSNTAFTGVLGEYVDLFLYKHNDSLDLAEKIYSFIFTAHDQYILEALNTRVRKDYGLGRLIEKIILEMK